MLVTLASESDERLSYYFFERFLIYLPDIGHPSYQMTSLIIVCSLLSHQLERAAFMRFVGKSNLEDKQQASMETVNGVM